MFYQIFRIESVKENTFSFSPFEEKYFVSTLSKNILCHHDNTYSIYKIFDIYFCVKWADSEDKLKSIIVPDIKILKDTFQYKAFSSKNILTDAEISQCIRGTNTLSITSNNKIANELITIVIDQRGFCVSCNKSNLNNRLEDYVTWTLHCMLLALAYNYTAEEFNKKTVQLQTKDNNTKELIEHRKKMFAFTIENYCHYPVIEGRYFVSEIWEKVSVLLKVQTIHDEMKFQIQDLVSVIEAEQNKTLIKKYNFITIVLSGLALFFAFIGIFPFILKILNYYDMLSDFWKIFIE